MAGGGKDCTKRRHPKYTVLMRVLTPARPVQSGFKGSQIEHRAKTTGGQTKNFQIQTRPPRSAAPR